MQPRFEAGITRPNLLQFTAGLHKSNLCSLRSSLATHDAEQGNAQLFPKLPAISSHNLRLEKVWHELLPRSLTSCHIGTWHQEMMNICCSHVRVCLFIHNTIAICLLHHTSLGIILYQADRCTGQCYTLSRTVNIKSNRSTCLQQTRVPCT
jgi:hypothetical protein